MPRRKSRPERWATELDQWSDPELNELIAIAEAILESRSVATAATSVTPRRVDGSLVGKRGGKGHIELKTINGCGPYRYLRYWGNTDTGKRTLKSVYLGKLSQSDG